MASRRMFAKAIIDSDEFLDMPMSARLLYYDLGMRADDDGFVNSPKKIMKMVGATNDDMNILIMRSFIIPFDNGIVVIRHWRINNYLRRDRYVETQYKEEKSLLDVDDSGRYNKTKQVGIPGGIPVVATGKDSIGKDIYISSNEDISQHEDRDYVNKMDVDLIMNYWNALSVYGITPVKKLISTTNRYKMLKARIREYGVDDVVKAIESIKRSDFLKGKNDRGWMITFDWFVKPNNFPKVLDGKYVNKQEYRDPTVQKNNGRQ